MRDAWSLFDGDDASGARGTSGAREGGAGVDARAREDRRASASAFFAGARDADVGGDDEGARALRRAVEDDFVMFEAWERALGEGAPHGEGARDALARARDACGRRAGREASASARRCVEACARQLEHGNWPNEGFLRAHALAHGVLILSALELGDEAEDADEAGENDPTAAAAFRGENWDRRTRLGRIGLDMLTASTLFRAGEAPRCCAIAAELVQRAFAADEKVAPFPFGSEIPRARPIAGAGVPSLNPARTIPFEKASELSVARFYTEYVAKERPVVIKDHLGPEGENWGLFAVFSTLDIFKEYGNTIVPVEYGTAFESHGTGVMTLESFARTFLAPSNEARDSSPSSDKVAYVSQHPLFHQIPALQEMFTISPYCLGRISVETSAINCWIGTSGTKTAIHRDPYLNLLCQISGHKYVRIYDEQQTKFLYCSHGDVLRAGNANTFTRSPVDPEDSTDAEKHPLARRAEFLETIIEPGDVLFMPKGHWHYVRSLSTSVSVNFWF